jgi:hypothetical protein
MSDYVYMLWHQRPLGPEETDDPTETNDKLCGVFSSPELARKAQSTLVLEEGFRDYPDCFEVDRVRIGELLWDSGFVLDFPDQSK